MVVLAIYNAGVVSRLAAQRPTQTAPVASQPAVERARSADALLARHITLHLTHVTIKQALDSAARAAHTVVQYQVPLLTAYVTPITVDVDQRPLGVVLEQILAETSLHAVSDEDGALAIVPATDGARDSTPSTGTIAGRVTDSATGRGIAGATVKIGGTKLSAVTTDSGRFRIMTVPTGDMIITVKVFGYRPAERTVHVGGDSPTMLRIALAAAPNVLSGVVTTAVGDLDRRKIGNDVTMINADSVMRAVPIRTVTDLLENRVPGLTVTHSSGVPGAPSRLRLRGIGGGLVPGATNTSNDPIVIVDGMQIYSRTSTARDQNGADNSYTAPSPIDQIDPSTIDKIEVFKGPSAAALYGSEAANGVIVITTKKGQVGAPQIHTRLDASMQRLPGQYAGPAYYFFGHSLAAEESSEQCGGLGPHPIGIWCILDSTRVFQALASPRFRMTALGNTTAANLSASGGASTLTYYLSAQASSTLGYLRMPPVFEDQYARLLNTSVPGWMTHPDTYRIWNGTGDFTSTPYPSLTLRYTTSLATSDQQQTSAQSQLSQLASSYVDTLSYDENQLGFLTGFAQRIRSHQVTTGNAWFASLSRWAWLPMQGGVGLSGVDRQDEALGAPKLTGTDPSDFKLTDQSYTFARPTSQTRTVNLNGTLFPDRQVKVSLGLNTVHTSIRDLQVRQDSIPDGVTLPSQFDAGSAVTSSQTTGGWFVEPQLNPFPNLYWSPGFRIDQSGVSGTNGASQKFGGLTSLFPKMGFSWIAIDRQSESPALGFLTLVRPRLAFGVGGVAPDPTQLYRIYTPAQPAVGNGRISYPGVRLTTIGNPILRPERSREFEGGGDVQLWGNRLTFTASGYERLRLDAIELVALAPSLGGENLQQYRNLGKIRNRGIEIQAEVVVLQNASTTWSIRGNYSSNENLLMRLNDASRVINEGNGIRYVPGYPLDGQWARPIIGYRTPAAGQKLSVADIVLGDSVAYLGSGAPDYQFPMSTSLALFHGALDVNANFEYKHGVTQFASGSARELTNLYVSPGTSLSEQAAAIAAFCTTQASNCTPFGSLAGVVQTVNVFRFNTLAVNYNVPTSFARRLRLSRMTVGVNGTNLGLWTGYRGKDPDVNGKLVGETLEDNGQPPLPRIWGIQVQLN